jgi:signal transduction histidine kinase
MKDFTTIVALSFAASALAGLVGAAFLHLLRRRDSSATSTPVVPDGVSANPIPEERAALLADLDATRRTLAETRSRQQAAEDARRELVSFMSNDLRTPLAGLRALVEGLEDGLITDVPAALGYMRTTVDRMSHLVDDLFELSRVPSSRPAESDTLVLLWA